MSETELIQNLIEEFNGLQEGNSDKLNEVKANGEMIIRRIFGESSKNHNDYLNVFFYPGSYYVKPSFTDYTEEQYNKAWQQGMARMLYILNSMLNELKLFGAPQKIEKVQKETLKSSKNIFIVHGHNEEMKQSVARVIEKLDLKPIILHEQPNQGLTIIEKFEEYSDVSFAVVLLSPDDLAYPRDLSPEEAQFRARQNVIFELGFFVGRLGRSHVFILYGKSENFEIPIDYTGVLYTPFDDSDKWQLDLVKELKACGYDIDANKLL